MEKRPYEVLHSQDFKGKLELHKLQHISIALDKDRAYETSWVYDEKKMQIGFVVTAFGSSEELNWREGEELKSPELLFLNEGYRSEDVKSLIDSADYIPAKIKNDVLDVFQIMSEHLPIKACV